MAAKLISIMGPPASGKTTLAEALAADLGGTVVYEDYQGNEFVSEAYSGNADACLPSQLYYLISRVSQLSRWAWPPDGLVVTDYGFCQDRIYARATLSEADWAVYLGIADRLAGLVQRPALIVHLDAPNAVLMARIARRGRDFERGMDERFLSTIRRGYNDIEAREGCPVLRVDCDATDLRDVGARAELLAGIREQL